MQRTKTPTSLQAQAEQRANEDHTRRLADIAAMAPLLAKLDAFAPALASQGLTVYPDSLRLTHEAQGARRMKVLRLSTDGMFCSVRPAKWLAALLAQGFAEVKRSDSAYPTALLRHGTLLLEVDVPRDPRAAAIGALRYAHRMAAAAGVAA